MTIKGHFSKNKYLLFILFLMIFCLFSISLRQFIYQLKHYKESEISSGVDRVKAYERIILNHFPLSPYTKKAVNALLNECETFKENDEKLYCYETLRTSLIQIKSFYQPYSEVLEMIKPKIADLRAKEKIVWKYNNLTMADYEKIYNEQMAILNYDNAPSMFWSFMTVFSLLGWIGSVIMVILKGLTKPVNRRILSYGVLSYLLFFSLWLLGLWMS